MKWFLQKEKLKAKTWLDKEWFLQNQKPKTKTKITNDQPLNERESYSEKWSVPKLNGPEPSTSLLIR